MVTILFFAHLQEEAGENRIQLELSDMTMKDLKVWLQDNYKLTQMGQVMCSINEEYAMDGDVVKSGDTVALIPPVSGG